MMVSIDAIKSYASIYPRQYIAYRVPPAPANNDGDNNNEDNLSSSMPSPAVTIDGNLDKDFWKDVDWTDNFVDIATDTAPKFQTRVKMRWDDEYLYVGAYLEESDVWGTLTEHNSVIFHDNDFEVFVDTEGSNHNYKEFEINALGTTWSLLLNKPYADNGGENSKRVDADGYDIGPHLQSAVKVYPDGAINQPTIKNICWTVEIAFPISKLMERNPLAKKPADNVFWRINFSRVQWGWKLNGEGQYEKEPCCQTCAAPGSVAEDNWVWSRQGEVAMHLPERWGIVQFESYRQSGGKMRFYDEWPCRCAAMAMYYAMKRFHETEGKYPTNVEDLKPHANSLFPICDEAEMSISLTNSGYEARASIASYAATVNEERYLVVLPDKLASDMGSAVTA